ncbi:hypothetical protein F5Y14DRAFT_188395 [Nemania sp. NC0429]|nr:hypothetical protein F5Y14DRAFT_188395 [Nemania sp. NC0429]
MRPHLLFNSVREAYFYPPDTPSLDIYLLPFIFSCIYLFPPIFLILEARRSIWVMFAYHSGVRSVQPRMKSHNSTLIPTGFYGTRQLTPRTLRCHPASNMLFPFQDTGAYGLRRVFGGLYFCIMTWPSILPMLGHLTGWHRMGVFTAIYHVVKEEETYSETMQA